MKSCPHGSCSARVADGMFACRRHWFELSQELRRKIWRDYRNGDVDEILANYEAADAEWA